MGTFYYFITLNVEITAGDHQEMAHASQYGAKHATTNQDIWFLIAGNHRGSIRASRQRQLVTQGAKNGGRTR